MESTPGWSTASRTQRIREPTWVWELLKWTNLSLRRALWFTFLINYRRRPPRVLDDVSLTEWRTTALEHSPVEGNLLASGAWKARTLSSRESGRLPRLQMSRYATEPISGCTWEPSHLNGRRMERERSFISYPSIRISHPHRCPYSQKEHSRMESS
jgi:hypothetical protein